MISAPKKLRVTEVTLKIVYNPEAGFPPTAWNWWRRLCLRDRVEGFAGATVVVDRLATPEESASAEVKRGFYLFG